MSEEYVDLSGVDAARLDQLIQKSKTDGLQESEKEEMKQLMEKERRTV